MHSEPCVFQRWGILDFSPPGSPSWPSPDVSELFSGSHEPRPSCIHLRLVEADFAVLYSFCVFVMIKTHVSANHPILTWLPRHGANCLTMCRIGEDCKTAEEGRTRKRWLKPVLEIGERIQLRPAPAQEPMWTPTSNDRETLCVTSFQDRKHLCDEKLQPHVAGGTLGLC